MGHFCPQFYLITAEVHGNLLGVTQQTSLEDKSAIEGYWLCLIVQALHQRDWNKHNRFGLCTSEPQVFYIFYWTIFTDIVSSFAEIGSVKNHWQYQKVLSYKKKAIRKHSS